MKKQTLESPVENDARRGRIWMWASLILVASLAASWIPELGLALGDDHKGRILGRVLLHVDNLMEKGWTGSKFGADWQPYSNAPYAHHPPLGLLIHAGVAMVQGHTTALTARLIGLVGGMLTVGTLGALVRKLTDSWLAMALAIAGLATSGYFWFFGRGVALIFPLVYFLLRCLHLKHPRTPYLASIFLVGVLGALSSWAIAMIIGLVALYDLFRASVKIALVPGIGVAVGLGLDFLWIESAAGVGALFSHVEARAAAADYTILEWIVRQGAFYLRFESIPVFVLTAIALIFGLRDERFRPLVGSLFLSVIVFMVAFHQNAFVHEYWNSHISLVLALGLGAMGAWLIDRGLTSWQRGGLMALLVISAAVPVLRLGSENYDLQYSESSKAGELIANHPFPPDQSVAWYYGDIPGPRWYSWYTDLPVAPFHVDAIVDPEALVLVERKSDDGLGDLVYVAEQSPYYLVTAGDLMRAITGDR